MDLSTIITIGGFLVAVATFLIGRLTGAKKTGQNQGAVLTELGYIKAGVDDIKLEQKEQAKTNTEFSKQLAIVTESAKQAHKRLDEHISKHN